MGTSIYIFHGYGANANDLKPLESYWKTGKDQKFYFPEAPISLVESMGWPPFYNSRAWFHIDVNRVNNSSQTFSSESPPELDSTLDYIKNIIDANGEQEKIILGGFSQGAMCAYHFYNKYREEYPFIGLFLMSSALIDSRRLKLEGGKQVPIYQSHGKSDHVLPYESGNELKDLLSNCGYSVRFSSFDGQHEIPLTIIEEVKQYIASLT